MAYRREGKKVILEMTPDEYDLLLFILGYAFGARRATEGEDADLDRWIVFVNNLNVGNPNFNPYEVPSDSV